MGSLFRRCGRKSCFLTGSPVCWAGPPASAVLLSAACIHGTPPSLDFGPPSGRSCQRGEPHQSLELIVGSMVQRLTHRPVWRKNSSSNSLRTLRLDFFSARVSRRHSSSWDLHKVHPERSRWDNTVGTKPPFWELVQFWPELLPTDWL